MEGDGGMRITPTKGGSGLKRGADASTDVGHRTRLRYSERELRARAERVLSGTQSGAWTKLEMARDILTLLDRIERARRWAHTSVTDLRDRTRLRVPLVRRRVLDFACWLFGHDV